jgi:opacity protein-like surface antigen
MKKIFMMAIAILSFNLNAQQDSSFGAKAGLNLSKITLSASGTSDASDNLVAFHLGLFYETKIADKFTFQPELLYSAQGGEENNSGFKLNYIQIPLMFKYYPSSKFSLEAGPQIGFLVSSSVFQDSASFDADELFTGIDFGLGIGLNYSFTDKVFINARYNFGLTDVSSDDFKTAIANEVNVQTSSISMKNSNFQIGLGLRF